MTFYFTKFFFLYMSTMYICLKITNINFSSNIVKLITSLYCILLAFITALFKQNISELTYIIPIILLWIFINFFNPKPQMNFVATTISFGISYGLLTLSSSLLLLVLSPIYYNDQSSPYLSLAISSGILQYFFTICLFRVKRFRKGMPFLLSTTFVNVATTVSLLLIAFLIYIPTQYSISWLRIITPFFFISVIIIIIHWWQAQITKSYKQALERRELESLRTELAEKDKLLTQLTRQNEELGRLIHQDNKRIPAMEHAVCEYLVTDFENTENALSKGNELLLEIKELSQNRSNSLTEIYANKFKHHDTGISSLDTMLNYMEKRASQEHIQFSVNIAIDLNTFVPNVIDTNDLTHILSDLLENAIIATTHSKNPTVQLQFYLSEKHFVLEVADNGIPFETISLVNFGLTQLTTHADTGGSGIGLMDIWRIKEKYASSLHITEYDTEATYSKKIALIFDKKHRYSISSYRKDELLQLSKRTDLQIF